MIVGDLEGKFFQKTAAMHDIPMFESQKSNCFKDKQARILAGDLDIKHIYHISKKKHQ